MTKTITINDCEISADSISYITFNPNGFYIHYKKQQISRPRLLCCESELYELIEFAENYNILTLPEPQVRF